MVKPELFSPNGKESSSQKEESGPNQGNLLLGQGYLQCCPVGFANRNESLTSLWFPFFSMGVFFISPLPHYILDIREGEIICLLVYRSLNCNKSQLGLVKKNAQVAWVFELVAVTEWDLEFSPWGQGKYVSKEKFMVWLAIQGRLE